MNTLWRDVRFALRSLRRAPGFALGVITVLALGAGANTAMFTIIRATLLQPLHFAQPGSLVSLTTRNAMGEPAWMFLPDIVAWQARSHTLESLAYYAQDNVMLNGGKGEAEVLATAGSAQLFPTLGAQPMLGRTFTTEEQGSGHSNVIVLSYPVWQTQFGGDPQVLGRTTRIDDTPYTVIGVMPKGFSFPVGENGALQVWKPATLKAATTLRDMDTTLYDVIARCRAGVSPAEVAAELTSVQRTLAPLYANTSVVSTFVPFRVEASGFRQGLFAEQRKATLALMAAVGLLWLIACADVVSLSLARAAARQRDAALRFALGATRWHHLRQTLTEALLLSFCGGVLGLALSQGTLMVFGHRLAQSFGQELTPRPDGTVLGALSLLCLVSALVLCIVPALFSSSQISLERTLHSGSAQAGTGRRQHRLQRVLVVGELALTLCLLVGCGLLLRTVFALRKVPLGFRTEHVFVVNPKLPFAKYKNLDPNAAVYKPLSARLRALPGVESLAVTSVAPLSGRFNVTFTLALDGNAAKSNKARDRPSINAVLRASGPDLQEILGFRMAQGRFFNASDTTQAQPVAVVNRAFAKMYTPDGGDISRFQFGGKDRKFQVVGVMDDFHQSGIGEAAKPEIDLNAAQLRPNDAFYQPTLKAHAEIMLRSARDPQSFLPELHRALIEVNPDLAGAQVQTMSQIVDDSMGDQLLAAHLLEVLGGLALLVALTGLYSLLTYLVTLRTREVGVRLALGAQRAEVVALVLRGAAGLLLAGTVLGLALSFAGTRLLSRFLYGVQADDLGTFLGAASALLAIGLLAAWLPAQHAASIEPTEALRAQ